MNKLADQSSPYLLQHAHNPVNWYPWGEEALAQAAAEDKPILLSIGYAACHWCHVMAHESFEDPNTAAYMNAHFVNIKVDREERPDLDRIYMDAVVALTGSGGWPMTVFLTPKGEPFYGGTYFPPQPRYGMPGFMQVLRAVAETWERRREEVLGTASQLIAQINRKTVLQTEVGKLTPDLLEDALLTLARNFDSQQGGFSGAPKFPPSMTLEFLLREHVRSDDQRALEMAQFTLQKMAYGGIYDQIGGGFARYSVDDHWLVPHFEKMLYDNAQLARVYLHAWQITRQPLYRRIVEETLDYVLREMRHPEGGFYSSQDADSEGVEGKFYVWQKDEIEEVLGTDAELVSDFYGASESGNWEGVNILHVTGGAEKLAEKYHLTGEEVERLVLDARRKLFAYRSQRVPPGLDDKVLTAWNGLMMAAFAEAGVALGRWDYLKAAQDNAAFLYVTMRSKHSRLLRNWKDGTDSQHPAFLEDYVYLIEGLLSLYQSDFDPRWFTWAQELVEITLAHFSDTEHGGFYDTADDHEQLIQRPKTVQDNATPSGNAMAATVLLKLSLFTGEARYWDTAAQSIAALNNALRQAPSAFSQWLCAAHFTLSLPQELAIIGDPTAPDTQALLEIVRSTYRPNLVVAVGVDSTGTKAIPLLADRPQIGGSATAYLCRGFTCQMPVTEAEGLRKQLGEKLRVTEVGG